MSYLGNNPEIDASVKKYEYSATANQTTFSATYDQRVDVYLNGVLLSNADYTATNGTQVILGSGAASGDVIQIDAYQRITNNAGTNETTYGLYEHANTISGTYTIQTGNNAMSAGPVSIGSGASVTVPTGSTWTIV